MTSRRGLRLAILVLLVGAVSAGGWYALHHAGPPPPPKNEIPPANLSAYLRAHEEGLGFMERYNYPAATKAFAKAHELAPGLHAGSVNLAIAMLNDTGTEAEKKKKAGATQEEEAQVINKFDECIALLDDVIESDPDHLHAHYCRGIILEYLGRAEEAHPDFKFVAERDPSDAETWLHVGSTLTDPNSSSGIPGKEKAKEMVEYYTKSFERNPYNVVTQYKLQRAYKFVGDEQGYARLFALWNKMAVQQNEAGPGDSGALEYGQMGKYATVIDPLSGKTIASKSRKTADPRFDTPRPMEVSLPPGDRWVKAEDFSGALGLSGRFRDRFGAAVATLDADGDGKLDLYLCSAVVGPQGVRDCLLLNKGDGKFVDGSSAFAMPANFASLAVAAADFDADRHTDLFVCGASGNRLYRNCDGVVFENQSWWFPRNEPPMLSVAARWADLDQDGDLDLFVVNYGRITSAGPSEFPDKGMSNAAYRNDSIPPESDSPAAKWAPTGVLPQDASEREGLTIRFRRWDGPDAKALEGGDGRHTGVAILDIDNDRDLDLVLSADGETSTVVLNDRLGKFRAAPSKGLEGGPSLSGLLVMDLDKDGRADLVGPQAGGALFARFNTTTKTNDGEPSITFETFPADARSLRSARVADLDLDGTLDLLGLPAPGGPGAPIFSRGETGRLATSPLSLGPDSTAPLQGLSLGDLVGDPLPDLLLVRDGEAPAISRNRGNGNHWIALQLGGRWDVNPKHMRTNSEAIGVRVTVEGDGLLVPYDHTTPEAGPVQSSGAVVLGLGSREKARLVRLKWPDGVLQCELDEDADQALPLVENNRKEGSCPVLFTWDGRRFVCLGDFLGGGGLGYLVAPGVYGDPDRDEAVAIAPDQLKPVNGVFRMSITEPMSELAYLDRVTLDVVDRPPGVSSTTDERFAPAGPRPTGAVLAWKEQIEPVRAQDLKGKEISADLRAWDRSYASDFNRSRGWIGYAEEHGIVLDFGDRLSNYGPKDRLVLCLAGYTEYPYSQTNYAAATAGVALMTPVLERQRDDGTWAVLESDPGYPAGMARMTTLELTGKLTGPKCVLRLRTNMDIGWDQAFIAPILENGGLKVTTLDVDRAVLGHRGYTREVSPDGRLPLIYDYDYVDPAPLARLAGKLTRFGDVAELLHSDDDQLCVIGPGDEVKLEFDGKRLPPLPERWTRSFVLRTIGYCKDADPFTAASDSVGPLPWRGMPKYPFAPTDNRPEDVPYRLYLDWYQTRSVGR